MLSQPLLCLLLTLSAAALPGTGSRKNYLPDRRVCLNTTSEYFDPKTRRCCSKCQPGWRISQYCSETTDTKCVPCGSKQYTEYWNQLKKCRACEGICSPDQDMVQDCTPSTMRICHCREGLHCIDTTGKTCNRCRKHTECPEGQGVIRQGTKDRNVECGPCASGTFSNKVSSTEQCGSHTDCADLGRKTLQNGSNVNDTICSKELLPQPPTQITTTPAPGTTSPAPTKVSYPTEMEPETAIGRNPSTNYSLSLHSVVAISIGSFVVMTVGAVIMACVFCKRAGRKPESWEQNSDTPMKRADPVEKVCLIGVTDNAPEGVSTGNGRCEQNGGVTGSVCASDRLCSLSRTSSGGSRGVDMRYSSREVDCIQTRLPLVPLTNYSRIDSQEDQGYISRESRPSSGAPSPVIEFSGIPTVSVTINTGKCYVNCCHRQGDGACGLGSAGEDLPTPEKEEGAELDEGFPIQEEQKDVEWEAGERHWGQDYSAPHQEAGKESQLPVQDTCGTLY